MQYAGIYRQKDASIKAIQWTGENLKAVQDFLYPDSPMTHTKTKLGITIDQSLVFVGLHDWIVKDDNALFLLQVVNDATFQRRYEPVPTTDEETGQGA